MDLRKAVSAVEKYGLCLTFPIDNSKDTPSLWYHFFPKSKMRWEWDSGGDNRVAELWHLREQLSRSGKVVYGKWFKGRATFFSKDVFTALHHRFNFREGANRDLTREAAEILSTLDDNSPLSTKQLKRAVSLEGRDLEGVYTRSLKSLWDRLMVVGFGEVDDGAFPSLAIGSTRNLFDELYQKSAKGKTKAFEPVWKKLFAEQSPVEKQVLRLEKKFQSALSESFGSDAVLENP